MSEPVPTSARSGGVDPSGFHPGSRKQAREVRLWGTECVRRVFVGVMNPKDPKTHDTTLCFCVPGLRADIDPGATSALDRMEGSHLSEPEG